MVSGYHYRKLMQQHEGFYEQSRDYINETQIKARLEHNIARNHMAHSRRRDKSYLISNDKAFIYKHISSRHNEKVRQVNAAQKVTQ